MPVNMDKLIEELEAAALLTRQADLQLFEALAAEDAAEERLKDLEARLQMEAADKEKHPELTNDKMRAAWVQIELGLEKTAVIALSNAKLKKLKARIEYDYCRRREADLRAIVGGRNAT